jgi:hypothetical protein
MLVGTMASVHRATHLTAVIALAAVVVFQGALVPAYAHHTGGRMSVPTPGCGWAEGDSLRDRSNLSRFCQQSIPTRLDIRMAAADHEVVQIEASPALVAALHDERGSVAALMRGWLDQWRALSGYRSASIALTRNHLELAKVYTTMSGDVVIVWK